jgi:hypothetical protein
VTDPRSLPEGTTFFADDNVGLLALLPDGSMFGYDGGRCWPVKRESPLNPNGSTSRLPPEALEPAFEAAGFPASADSQADS